MHHPKLIVYGVSALAFAMAQVLTDEELFVCVTSFICGAAGGVSVLAKGSDPLTLRLIIGVVIYNGLMGLFCGIAWMTLHPNVEQVHLQSVAAGIVSGISGCSLGQILVFVVRKLRITLVKNGDDYD